MEKEKITLEKQIPRIISIGILWGIVELYGSRILKGLQPELFSIWMPFIVALLLISAKRLAPMRGSVLLMGVIAALMKFFFAGMSVEGPFIAILCEAALAEALFVLLGVNFRADISVGVGLQLYSAFHPLLTKGLFCNSIHFVKFKRWVLNESLFKRFEWGDTSVMAFFLALHVLAGIFAALLFAAGIKLKEGVKK
ncbi:hypothetical protein Calab_3611 [Caldithrix abyssi DSM 13497]|uniref:Energy-coupling factor transport system substrate-specific component n=1 Tax=Caldithrix abyssi DSM 13497 TaxID=880073 RepID=H1XYE2_CALAY|nr:hypothetical protein [Caldithrix abyssi]APF19304.1 hypothetical protein Cabys_2555 [Caldithrix abyssi DSM 13497]EHO43209.1 hypothetical protein Calab_3611 [Caldithrix abyssi DSM 13497]